MDVDLTVEQNEICRRQELQQKIGQEKLSADEILWLETHREFSRIQGPLYLKRDVISLEQGVSYRFLVKLLEAKHPDEIYPCFRAPGGIGAIRTDVELTDARGKKSRGKPVKILAAVLQQEHPEFQFLYSSDCGVLAVDCFCRYYNPKQHLRTGGFSGNMEGFYLLREDPGPNSALYRCKAPYAERWDSLVFSLQWEREEDAGLHRRLSNAAQKI